MKASEVWSIRTRRLELVSLSKPFLEAITAGRLEEAAAELGATLPPDWPDAHDAGFLALRLRQLRRRPDSREWSVRAIVLSEGALMVGHVGFHGPPGVNALERADAVELGYQVFPAHRERGYASEAVEALMRWAQEERGISAFVASIAPDNEPSLRIVRRLGFVHVGEHWDDVDGLEHEYIRELP